MLLRSTSKQPSFMVIFFWNTTSYLFKFLLFQSLLEWIPNKTMNNIIGKWGNLGSHSILGQEEAKTKTQRTGFPRREHKGWRPWLVAEERCSHWSVGLVMLLNLQSMSEGISSPGTWIHLFPSRYIIDALSSWSHNVKVSDQSSFSQTVVLSWKFVLQVFCLYDIGF